MSAVEPGYHSNKREYGILLVLYSVQGIYIELLNSNHGTYCEEL